MADPILSARALRKVVRDGDRDAAILDDVTLAVEPGERVALVGPSGSGKSTLLHILGALDPDFEGEVEIAGRSVGGLSDAELAAVRNQTLGFVFQAYNLLGHLSVLDNVLLPARFGEREPDVPRAHEVLALVRLRDKSHRRPDTLSGGERQRVAIARALYNQPRLVLCDEPTGNLDVETGLDVLAVFERLTGEGISLLVATHDPAIAETATRVLNLKQGRLQS